MFKLNDIRPVVLSGPSGAGKSTLILYLLRDFPFFHLCVSHTTREKRKHEKDGKEYFFITKEEFERKIKAGEFFEYQEYNGNYYGTSNSEINVKNKIAVLDWERKGALAARRRGFNAWFIFVWCPKVKIEIRLRKRTGKEILNDADEKEIQGRMLEYDEDVRVQKLGVYDISIENTNIEEAQAKLYTFLSLINKQGI